VKPLKRSGTNHSFTCKLCHACLYLVSIHQMALPVTCDNARQLMTHSSSSCMRVMNHKWSVTKQCLHPQSVTKISRHSVLSGDRIQQRATSSGSFINPERMKGWVGLMVACRATYTNFVLISRQRSLTSILMQMMQFYGEWFEIYHVQNFVQFFSATPCTTTTTTNRTPLPGGLASSAMMYCIITDPAAVSWTC